MNKTRLSILLLVITTLIWGLSFLVVQDSFTYGWSPLMMIFFRSLLGALVCLPFCFHSQWWRNRGLIRDAILCGLFYFSGFAFQSYGQLYSSIPNAAFLTTLNVLFVPFILLFIFKKKVEKKVYIAAFVALLGTAILAWNGPVGINKGDIYLLLCAIGFAFQIIFTQKAAQHGQAFVTSFIQLLTMAILGLIGLVITHDFSLPSQGWGGILYIGILATGACGIMQMYAQKHVSPSTTSLIYSLESGLAATAAMVFGYQDFAWRIVIGGVLMILAVLIVEIKGKKFNKNHE